MTGDGSKANNPHLYWLDSTAAVSGRPQWKDNPKDNGDWLVGCDETCQIIDKNNPQTKYSASETIYKCPPEYTKSIDCTDRCGDGIYDGLINFNEAGRNRSTKPYPTGVNGYTP